MKTRLLITIGCIVLSILVSVILLTSYVDVTKSCDDDCSLVYAHGKKFLIGYELEYKPLSYSESETFVKNITYDEENNGLIIRLSGGGPSQMTLSVPRGIMDSKDIQDDKAYDVQASIFVPYAEPEKFSEKRVIVFDVPIITSIIFIYHK